LPAPASVSEGSSGTESTITEATKWPIVSAPDDDEDDDDCAAICEHVRFEVFAAVTMKNVVFWDIETQFVPHRRLYVSTTESSR
jgi:hypothetical protein